MNRGTAEGALVGTLVGDALGAPYEGAPGVSLAEAGERIDRALTRGSLPYTDDTQMALALAEHLVTQPDVDPEGLAEAFLEAFESWRGYGGGMHALVELWRRGVPVAEAATAVFPDGSLGNGGAMRVAPVGVRWAHDTSRLEAAARRSVQTTHVHPAGVAGGVAQARAVGIAAATGRFGASELRTVADTATEESVAGGLREAARMVEAGADDPNRATEVLGNDVVAHRSVPAALWAAVIGGSFEGAIRCALAVGGDADTIAAMAGAVRGAADGSEAIPPAWTAPVEGSERVRATARRLADSAGGSCSTSR